MYTYGQEKQRSLAITVINSITHKWPPMSPPLLCHLTAINNEPKCLRSFQQSITCQRGTIIFAITVISRRYYFCRPAAVFATREYCYSSSWPQLSRAHLNHLGCTNSLPSLRKICFSHCFPSQGNLRRRPFEVLPPVFPSPSFFEAGLKFTK